MVVALPRLSVFPYRHKTTPLLSDDTSSYVDFALESASVPALEKTGKWILVAMSLSDVRPGLWTDFFFPHSYGRKAALPRRGSVVHVRQPRSVETQVELLVSPWRIEQSQRIVKGGSYCLPLCTQSSSAFWREICVLNFWIDSMSWRLDHGFWLIVFLLTLSSDSYALSIPTLSIDEHSGSGAWKHASQ